MSSRIDEGYDQEQELRRDSEYEEEDRRDKSVLSAFRQVFGSNFTSATSLIPTVYQVSM